MRISASGSRLALQDDIWVRAPRLTSKDAADGTGVIYAPADAPGRRCTRCGSGEQLWVHSERGALAAAALHGSFLAAAWYWTDGTEERSSTLRPAIG